MLVVENILVSFNLVDQYFHCNTVKCKGLCCFEGDNGAPLEKEELAVLETIFLKVKPYLVDKAITSIERYGAYVEHDDGNYYTQLIEGRQCVYAVCGNDGVWKCAIEIAFNEGVITFQKPVSCHLYPVRIHNYRHYDAVNYDQWNICDSARKSGEKLGILLYEFLQEPLIRKYGKQWYNNLEKTIQQINLNKQL